MTCPRLVQGASIRVAGLWSKELLVFDPFAVKVSHTLLPSQQRFHLEWHEMARADDAIGRVYCSLMP